MKTFLIALMLTASAFAQDIYKIKEKGVDGKPYGMDQLKGKVVMIVNIASQCGYTPQLEKLESLYRKYQGKGFVVLGVPANNFGGQTPESDTGIVEFCKKNYGVTFPLLSKSSVKGSDMRELYRYLTEKSGKDLTGEVSWNFEKFLINRKGEVVGRMKSSVDPMDKDTLTKVETLL